MKAAIVSIIITLLLLLVVNNSIQVSEHFITGHKHNPSPKKWSIKKLSNGAVLYVKHTHDPIKAVRVFFPGARQSALDASRTKILKSMLELKDGMVCIVGKRGFDKNADSVPTYISKVICDEDAKAVMTYLTQFRTAIDIVGYSMGCNHAITASKYGARGVLLVAPILENLNVGMMLWSLRSVRNMRNLVRLVLHQISLSWLIEKISIVQIQVPYRIAIGQSDVYGYSTDNFIRLTGGHQKCMDFVEKDMCDFSCNM